MTHWQLANILWLFTSAALLRLAAYALFAGGYHTWLQRQGERLRRLQSRPWTAKSMRRELAWSMTTIVIFSLFSPLLVWAIERGWTRVYFQISDYGVAYLIFSIALLLVVHDAYFYLIHRLLQLALAIPEGALYPSSSDQSDEL